ncbi:class I peptide chain release factor, partial [Pavlovales sp. CCMP2436]
KPGPPHPGASLAKPGSPHPASLAVDELLRDVTVERTRRSGPGGQHRNKVESAIVVVHTPSGVRAEASERRSQHENKDMAVGRLRLRLALEVRTPPLAEGPSPLWRSRRMGDWKSGAGKIVVSEKHPDFPAIVAEALDFVIAREMDVKAAAAELGVSSSQLVKLLGAAQPALSNVNAARTQRGMPPLKS